MAASPKPSAPAAATASTQQGETGFSYTREDVVAGAASLLATLPEPSPVQGKGPVVGFGLQSDRDGKTINSLMIHTNKCKGFPRPEGSIVVVPHFDNQAQMSFENFCFEWDVQFEASETPHFVCFNQAQGEYKGMVDEEDPACHSYLKDVYFEFLSGLARRGDVGLLVADGLGDFIGETTNEVALYEAGVSTFSELKPGDWMPRRKVWRQLMNLIRGAVIPGGAYVVNGPEHKGDGEDKTVILPNGKRVQQKVKSKWLDRREIEKDLNVVIHVDTGQDEVGETTWVAQVLIGRFKGFRRGSKCDDLAGKHLWAIAEATLAES